MNVVILNDYVKFPWSSYDILLEDEELEPPFLWKQKITPPAEYSYHFVRERKTNIISLEHSLELFVFHQTYGSSLERYLLPKFKHLHFLSGLMFGDRFVSDPATGMCWLVYGYVFESILPRGAHSNISWYTSTS